MLFRLIFLLHGLTSAYRNHCPGNDSGRKIICYMSNWAKYYYGKGQFIAERIDPFLCTHLVYVYAHLNETTFLIQFSDYASDFSENNVKRFLDTKRLNPDLKFLIGLGGWIDSSSSKYSTLISDPAKRSAFNSHVREFLDDHNFDGLDLYWEFPGFTQGNENPNGSESDRTNFALWVSELRTVLECKLLTSVVSPYQDIAEGAYDPSIYEHLDWVSVLSFNYHGYWVNYTGHAAPLYSEANISQKSCNDSIHFYLELGCPPEKLVLGIPTYGRTWTLDDPTVNGIGAPASSPGIAGTYTEEAGLLSYFEIIDQNFTAVVLNERLGSYGYIGNQWVSFDDPDMVRRKALYVKETNLGGVMFSYINMDTFQPAEDAQYGPYNLIRTANEVLVPPRKVNRVVKGHGSSLAWNLLSILAILSCTWIIVGLVLYRRKINKLKSQLRELTMAEIDEFHYGNPNLDPNEVNAPIHSAPFDKKYELTENQLFVDFNKVLGSGQFGLVMLGSVHGDVGDRYANEPQQVAVKTVKKDVDALYFKALLSELKILAYLGKHDNIASLIGAQTDKITNRKIFIAIEFCAKGDLLQFLQKSRENFRSLLSPNGTTDKEMNADGTELIPLMYQNYINKQNKPHTCRTYVQDVGISTLELLEWASQIACGMAYLSIQKVIHGDLAARNVLLTANNVAKISDFGLSRQLLNYSNYVKTTVMPLPWRWMAIESLKGLDFSIQSDVWSYGVTLWEIFTFGEIPYFGLCWDHEFADKLSRGTIKLHCPKFADSKIYDLMLECWRKEPGNRISFVTMSTGLDDIIVSLCEGRNPILTK